MAGAHAVLLSSSPGAGQTLPAAPPAITLHFSEPVEIAFGSVSVYDPAGRMLPVGDARYLPDDSASLGVALPAGLRDGTYTVGWRVISADSHPVSGAFTFNIGAPGGSRADLLDQLREQTADQTVERAADVARFVLFTGLLLALGVSMFSVTAGRGRPDVVSGRLCLLVTVALAAALVGTAAGYALEGALAAGRGLGAAFDPGLWGDLARTQYGKSSIARLALTSGALLATVAPFAPSVRRALGLTLLVAAVASVSFGGHASTIDPAWAGRLGDTVHQLAAGTWFGGLVALVLVLRRTSDRDDRRALGTAFGRVALLAVAAVVVTGTLSALAQLGSPGELLSTRYGVTLLLKVGLVVFAVAGGAVNRFVIVPRLGAVSRDSLGVIAGIEAALLGCVLIVTAVLTGTAPPSPSAAGLAPSPTAPPVSRPVVVEGTAGPVDVFVELTPGTAGENSLHVHLSPSVAEPLNVEELTVSFELPSANLGPLRAELKSDEDFAYTGSVALSVAGEWKVSVRVRTSKFDAWTFEGTFDLP